MASCFGYLVLILTLGELGDTTTAPLGQLNATETLFTTKPPQKDEAHQVIFVVVFLLMYCSGFIMLLVYVVNNPKQDDETEAEEEYLTALKNAERETRIRNEKIALYAQFKNMYGEDETGSLSEIPNLKRQRGSSRFKRFSNRLRKSSRNNINWPLINFKRKGREKRRGSCGDLPSENQTQTKKLLPLRSFSEAQGQQISDEETENKSQKPKRKHPGNDRPEKLQYDYDDYDDRENEDYDDDDDDDDGDITPSPKRKSFSGYFTLGKSDRDAVRYHSVPTSIQIESEANTPYAMTPEPSPFVPRKRAKTDTEIPVIVLHNFNRDGMKDEGTQCNF